jgi:lipoprotein-anchoring transpeptidase ErfK/SrfK
VGPVAVSLCLGLLVGILAVTARPAEVVVARAPRQPPPGPAIVEGDWAAPAPEPEPVHPTSFAVADAVGPSIELFAAPDEPLGESLDNPTWEGLDVVFAVLEEQPGWLHVRVSSRPNGRTAWVRRGDVRLREVPNWIQVEVGARRLTVFHGDDPLLSTIVAVGREGTPTPIGSFFVDGLVPLDPPHPAYGAGQVSVSGFSETLTSFGGGIGQIALHGTQATALLGQSTSNGCVRLDDDAIRQVMALAPTGTPVEILP